VRAKGFYVGKFQVEPQGQRWTGAVQLLGEGQGLTLRRVDHTPEARHSYGDIVAARCLRADS